MNVESEKAHSFVHHLYSNPTLHQYTPLQREEQIVQFLNKNYETLSPTLSSAKFFPGYTWDRIVNMLFRLVRDKTDKLFWVDIKEVISHRINFNFLKAFKTAGINYDQVQEEMLNLIEEMLKCNVARRVLSGCYAAVLYNAFVRYLQVSYNQKKYVHIELTKVQRLNLSLDQVMDLMKVILLIMPIVWVIAEKVGIPIAETSLSSSMTSDLIKGTQDYLHYNLSTIPESIIKSAIDANRSFIKDEKTDATARIAAIFSVRCRNYHPDQSVERGAESPDKSWLYIARRNFKFYGFDEKILEEFYGIASERRW